jgi:hypothetical protein
MSEIKVDGESLATVAELHSEALARAEAAEARIAELEAEREQWKEREASCCPEDVGFEEMIATLSRQNEDAQARCCELDERLQGRFDLNRAMTAMAKAFELETQTPFMELSKPDRDSYIHIFEAALGALIYEFGGPPRQPPQRDTQFVPRQFIVELESRIAELEAENKRLRERLTPVRRMAPPIELPDDEEED